MTAKDINNKIIREADWVKFNSTGSIYQIHKIYKDGTLELWFRYIISNKKVIRSINAVYSNGFAIYKIDPPIAYNITDND